VEREIKLTELEPEMLLFLLSVLTLVVLYKIKFSARDAAWLTFPRLGNNFLHSLPYICFLNPNNTIQKVIQWHEKLGEVFLMTKHAFDSGKIFVSDPKIAQEISFHDPKRLFSSSYVSLVPWLGSTGFIQENWTRSKKFLNLLICSLMCEGMQRVSN
jgi:hypothetical protein